MLTFCCCSYCYNVAGWVCCWSCCIWLWGGFGTSYTIKSIFLLSKSWNVSWLTACYEAQIQISEKSTFYYGLILKIRLRLSPDRDVQLDVRLRRQISLSPLTWLQIVVQGHDHRFGLLLSRFGLVLLHLLFTVLMENCFGSWIINTDHFGSLKSSEDLK